MAAVSEIVAAHPPTVLAELIKVAADTIIVPAQSFGDAAELPGLFAVFSRVPAMGNKVNLLGYAWCFGGCELEFFGSGQSKSPAREGVNGLLEVFSAIRVNKCARL